MKLYKIPFLNYKYSIKDAFISLMGIIKKNYNSDYLINLFNNSNLFFINYARTGIYICLKSLKLPENSRVGVQAFNCPTVFTSIKKAGLVPVFLDINNDFQIDLDDLNRKKHKIDALITTHLFGIPNNLIAIKKIVRNIPIIEDCAHSFLSGYQGHYTGTDGDCSVFSIGKGKFPSIGKGGLILVNNSDLVKSVEDQISELPSYKISDEIFNIVLNLILSLLHNPFIYSLVTYHLKTYKQKFLSLKLKDEKKILESNKALFLRLAEHYDEYKNSQKYIGFKIINYFHDNFYFPKPFISDLVNNLDLNYFMIPALKNDVSTDISNCFLKYGIEVGKHFSKSLQYAKEFGYLKNECPNTEKIISKIITFPTYYKLPKNYVKRLEKIKNACFN